MPETAQAPTIEPPQRPRPETNDPAWRLLFDRLDAQDRDVHELKTHVNDDVEAMRADLATKVGHGEVLTDLWAQFRVSRSAQAVVAATVVAMTPVVIANWTALVESVRALFS